MTEWGDAFTWTHHGRDGLAIRSDLDNVRHWDDYLEDIPSAQWRSGQLICSHDGCSRPACDIVLAGLHQCDRIWACCQVGHDPAAHAEMCQGFPIGIGGFFAEPLPWLAYLAGQDPDGPVTVGRLLRWLRLARPLSTLAETATSDEPCTLYRCYDDDGELIYVGIAFDFMRRQRAHRATSPWFKYVCEVQTDLHATRESALAQEAQLIAEHNPRFNKRGRSV